MSVSEAVRRFVKNGMTVGIGGQNINRCAMAVSHEIIRQGIRDLTLVGCNLSIQMDILVGAGLVKKCICGTGNLERFGSTYNFRRAVERGELEVDDYSHNAMVARFLAGEMGLPFMPTRSMMGSDLLKQHPSGADMKWVNMANPWDPGDNVILLPAMSPDVSIVHVQRCDPCGNVVIDGILNHEPEMIRASRAVIVSCEEVVPEEVIRSHPERTVIPFHFVSAVVEQPFGAHPTATYGYYEYDDVHIRYYQDMASRGDEDFAKYLKEYVLDSADFVDYLEKIGLRRLLELSRIMRGVDDEKRTGSGLHR